MKKIGNIIIIAILLFLIGLFIRPEKVIYLPKITGQVIDQNGNPIQNAIVARIEEKELKNNDYELFKSQTDTTDLNGNFELSEKSKIEWFHTPLDLPFVYCYANFQVSKKGYDTYKTDYNAEENSKYNENLNACKGIVFKPKITLKKL
ncbi:carboxypeptidase-like regulatory domain-containing protein [Winogradskyella forsetii]|uniref:carboxypeptidase-like regulatory domain-containing protein n=1 Tax=Winogradskyella forsetii TaxID=2686077 RepID=UPI0015BDE16F|nr:carboxypeptidase-like regulatory domain-containing protein [Winogradskyella forsetii]